MKASDYIVDYLARKGVHVVFGYIGGMITHLVDSLGQSGKVQYIQTYHEQTAAIAAEGYALESGRFGVAICTSGPGVTNMLTGIADAYFGSVPVLFISGQVNTYEYKYDKPIRQQGFQEMDVVSVVKPITKYAVLLDQAGDIRYELEKAVYIATHGRKGPVVIDLPMNISRAEIDPEELRGYVPEADASSLIPVEAVRKLIEEAERPVLLVGGGCKGVHTAKMLDNYLAATGMPVVTSLMGRGLIDETCPNYVGMIGSYGNRCANMAVASADLLIALGSRLDTRQTGTQYQSFLKEGRIIHVDLDVNELNCHRIENRLRVYASVEDFLKELENTPFNYKDYTTWNAWIARLRRDYSQDREVERFVSNKAPYRLFQRLNQLSEEWDAFTVDVGQNQMWAAQTLKLKNGQSFVCSGGLAPMGFAMPAAIGMAFANPERTIWCITGDGGFQISVQALLTIAQYHLNIKVVVLNNAALGMITQFQHLYFSDRMYGTTREGGFINPDIETMSRACYMPYQALREDTLSQWQRSKGPQIFDYVIEGLTTVNPKLEFNMPIDKPSPRLPEEEYRGIMDFLKKERE